MSACFSLCSNLHWLALIERRLLLLELDGLHGFDLTMDPTLFGLAMTLSLYH